MSTRLEMLQVARLAPKLLGEAAPLVAQFLLGQIATDGGFGDRAGRGDLYYTVFGLDALGALRVDPPAERVAAFLRSFGDGDGLDLVSLAALARCRSALPAARPEDAARRALADRIARFRAVDGGYHVEPGAPRGTVYGCFLALGAHEDLGLAVPEADAVLRCVAGLRARDGGYGNERDMLEGNVPATAAAAVLSRQLGGGVDPAIAPWLLARRHPAGGFVAAPGAPIPDLLSTAIALHALAGLGVDPTPVREACIDFVDTLWTARGAFHGSWADDEIDCEYTFYGLLALGHLAA